MTAPVAGISQQFAVPRWQCEDPGLAVRYRPMARAGGIARLAAFILEGHDHGHERLLRGFPGLPCTHR
jgi:hypothetical protein